MRKNVLLHPTQVLLFLFLLFGGLYFAKSFLVPVCLAWLLALLFVPVANKLEGRGWKRSLSTLACVLILLVGIGGVVTLLTVQLQGFAKDADKMEAKVKGNISKLQTYVDQHFGIKPEKQEQMAQKQADKGGGKGSEMVTTMVTGVMGVAGNFVLVMVYIFLFLYFRAHFKKFIMIAVSPENKPEAGIVIQKSGKAVQKYLGGLSLMIVCLWVMYGIGFSIAGVQYALFFAVLCGLLEIVPFVGNLTGTLLTAMMAMAQGGTGVLVGVLITYLLVQFIQTYFIEPLVVGKGINIHPAFTIMAIVVGELVWGIAGMVLALPILAIVKIILDRIPELKPYGFLVGDEKE